MINKWFIINILLWFSLIFVTSLQSKSQSSFKIDYATPENEYLDGGAVDSLGNSYLVGARVIGYYETTHGVVMKVYNYCLY